MAKVLKEETYQALKSKADGYDAIVASIMKKNEDLKAEDITLEVIQEVISSGADSDNASEITELKTKLENITSERDTLKTDLTNLTEENTELKKLPGAKSVTDEKPKADTGAEEDEDAILAFADKHASDTAAIISKMKEANYKPVKI